MRKKAEYAKAAKEAGVEGARMKLARERALRGFYLGSGERAAAIERLKRWVKIAEEHLCTEGIDQIAWRIVLCLNADAFEGGDQSGNWLIQWDAEVDEDRKERGRPLVH